MFDFYPGGEEIPHHRYDALADGGDGNQYDALAGKPVTMRWRVASRAVKFSVESTFKVASTWGTYPRWRPP